MKEGPQPVDFTCLAAATGEWFVLGGRFLKNHQLCPIIFKYAGDQSFYKYAEDIEGQVKPIAAISEDSSMMVILGPIQSIG
jgi:hypothetical protein